ncbi:ribonuclease P protein component 3 [Methanobrevibacter olleyae]|uniref:Ribonuclease P protein component 3 n=1 Tax=Methanobrevibacter olleyae TaxID=294671 RepID=A0A126R194_METOL|nr:RNase P subunit p30 family protein [Methanobrevibacter olleyae]AMK15405.1 ribonuclease P subunit P30 [Methanobrevibacter olleyae]SFL48588.1 ribonuclease P/MRP protein subunit RPP1 [Methanobrevibacter olleyae]
MKFYDLNLRGQDYENDLALVKEANKFGWDYLNLNYSYSNFDKAIQYKDDLINQLSDIDFNQTYRNKKTNFKHANLSMGINILNGNSNQIRKITNKYRDKTNYISCLGGDLKINRSVCENYKIDVLSRPYYKRRDSGMNHVLAKEAARHNVAIELSFGDILNNYLRYRTNVISSFKEILMFHRKFKFPLILTTDSKSIYDIRSTRDISSFFKSIGFSDREIYNGFYYYPKKIIDFNKDRKNMIVQGVKVIDGADFTDTYDSLDSDLEEFDDFDDGFDGFIDGYNDINEENDLREDEL